MVHHRLSPGRLVFLESIPRPLSSSGEVEVADLVIRRSGEPHPPFRIEEEFPHGIFGLREWIFEDLPGLGIETGKFSDVKFGKPYGSIRVHLNAPVEDVLFHVTRWRSPFLLFAG